MMLDLECTTSRQAAAASSTLFINAVVQKPVCLEHLQTQNHLLKSAAVFTVCISAYGPSNVTKMGQSGSKKITAQDDAILAMKNQRDKLRQYQKRITVITTRETEIAKECLQKGNKQKALIALRRKKYQESLLAKTDSQLEQLEILVNDVEFARVQKDVMFGLQQGTMVLKQIHSEMGGIEGVEKLLADNEEAREYQKVRAFFVINQPLRIPTGSIRPSRWPHVESRRR